MMSRRLISLCLMLFSGLALPAQTPSQMPEARPWDKTPLTWDDFQARQPGPDVYQLSYCFVPKSSLLSFGNLLVNAWHYRTDMLPADSWCVPSFRTDETLRLLQMGFDYAELCCRRALVASLGGAPPVTDPALKEEVDSFMQRIYEATDDGHDTVAVRKWADEVASGLALTETLLQTKPCLSPRGVSFGGHVLSVYKPIYPGAFSAYFNPQVAYDIGINLYFNRVAMLMNCHMKRDILQQDIAYQGTAWMKEKLCTGNDICLSLGYRVLETDWLRLFPFAGLGVGDYSYRPKEWADAGMKAAVMYGFQQVAGLYADIVFFRFFNMASPEWLRSRNGLIEFLVRPCIFASHTFYPGLPHAWGIHFGISLDVNDWDWAP